jgi:hypothetical protein
MLTPTLRAHLECSAASAIVRLRDALYVVADDSTRLHVYDLDGRPARPACPLLPDALPAEARARKAVKPDLEMLTVLPDGGLLALGSGSTPRRTRAVRVPEVSTPERVSVIDASPLCAALGTHLADLNLEGAACSGAALLLLQRGNGAAGRNALVRLDLARVMDALTAGGPLTPDVLVEVLTVELGELPGGALGFTDATLLPGDPAGDLLFTAVAEGGGSTYEDGAFGGAVLGRLSARGEVRWIAPLEGPFKVEGLTATARPEGGVDLYLVADGDDPAVPAPLLSLSLSAAQLHRGA